MCEVGSKHHLPGTLQRHTHCTDFFHQQWDDLRGVVTTRQVPPHLDVQSFAGPWSHRRDWLPRWLALVSSGSEGAAEAECPASTVAKPRPQLSQGISSGETFRRHRGHLLEANTRAFCRRHQPVLHTAVLWPPLCFSSRVNERWREVYLLIASSISCGTPTGGQAVVRAP